ncbi:MAG: hypothetical protein KJN94_03605 [Gammaproteobacteria bacterium]|nr:hypothetical protein [Gammaproteobacteria bacterium]
MGTILHHAGVTRHDMTHSAAGAKVPGQARLTGGIKDFVSRPTDRGRAILRV